jgi:hypothetical protein
MLLTHLYLIDEGSEGRPPKRLKRREGQAREIPPGKMRQKQWLGLKGEKLIRNPP